MTLQAEIRALLFILPDLVISWHVTLSLARYLTWDVIYNEDLGLWQCCHSTDNNGKTKCADTVSESFQAKAPQPLAPAPNCTPPSASSSAVMTSASSSTSFPATSASAAAVETPPPSSSTPSACTKAGIGVGVALASLAAIIVLFFLVPMPCCTISRQRQGLSSGDTKHDLGAPAAAFAPTGYMLKVNGTGRQPEPDGKSRSELDTRARHG